MSELSAIERTPSPITTDTLTHDLRGLGLRAGDTVLVHSSLSSLGWVCGAAVAAVSALLAAVGPEGTVAMPAHTGDNSDPADWENPPVPAPWVKIIRDTMPAFAPDVTPTRSMGRIAECFRAWPGTLRSDHPQVSFTAHGPLAARITGTHALTPCMGMDTPLGALYVLDARILLLGVGYNRCTSFHLGEALSGRPERVPMGCAMLEEGKRVWRAFEDFDYDSDDFAAIGAAYEAAHPVRRGQVGLAACRLLSMRHAVDFATAQIAQRPRAAQ